LVVTGRSHAPTSALATELTVASLSQPRERQPGDRAPAPGDLGLVQALANSSWNLDNHNRDRFASPEALASWLFDRELIESATRVGEEERRRVLEVRDGLRAMLLVNNGAGIDRAAIERLNCALRVAGPFVVLDPSKRPDFRIQRGGLDQALAMIATIVAVAQLDGRWSRLKACRGDHCGWAFYDHSRNQGGSWCSMAVCGSRAKARQYRSRNRRGD
jgi:predicted RNA-binding Zn ribbon-like protein